MRFVDRDAIVSVIIPCLNEETAIGDAVCACLAEGADEVIVVDGGSNDGTVARARDAGAHVVIEPKRGYGLACATGVAATRSDCDIVTFIDGDGSDAPSFLGAIAGPVAQGKADFVMGSRLRGKREPGSLTPQQIVAGKVAGLLLRMTYGVAFTDMSPFRAIRRDRLAALGMREISFGWNLEMQIRVAASGLRILEIPVEHRCRRGGVSKVSGNLRAGIHAAFVIARTFVRLAYDLRKR